MKPSRLENHFKKVHADKKNKDLSHFQALKDIFSTASRQDNDGLRASYNISLLIAKSGKPHTISEELILPAVSEVLSTVFHKPASDMIKKIE